MILKTYKDLTDEHLKEAKASEITSIFDAEIEKINQDFVTEKNKLSESIKASEDKNKDLEDKYAKAQEQLTKVQEDLQKLIQANEQREREEIFSNRMNYFSAEYDLDEKTSNAIANRIKSLNEEDYKKEKEDLEILLAAKKKEKMPVEHTEKSDCSCAKCKSKKAKASEAKEAKASTEDKVTEAVVDEAIDKGEKTGTAVAATTAPTETQTQKFAKAFGKENWEFNFYKGRR
jgi:hypothetical protein